MSKLSWREKYLLSISESLNIKEIQLLRECSYNKACDYKDKAIKFCIKNGIDCCGRNIPTEALLNVTGKGIEYYYNKMLLEHKELSLFNGFDSQG